MENSFFQKIYFCSLLIFFDKFDKNKNTIVKMIDLDLTNNLKDIKNDKIRKNHNTGFISCINNLINILKNLAI